MIRNFFKARKLRPYKLCAMTLDVRGRAIRTCPRSTPEEGVHFNIGETTVIRFADFHSGESTQEAILVDNENMTRAIRPGDSVGFNSGELTAVVLETEQDCIKI